MTSDLNLRLDPATAYTPLRLTAHVSTLLNIAANRLRDVVILKRSIDARQRQVMGMSTYPSGHILTNRRPNIRCSRPSDIPRWVLTRHNV